MRVTVTVVVSAAILAACTGDQGPRQPLAVNLQVTGRSNLEPMMAELDRRGLVATLWLSAAEVSASCELLGTYAGRGHEIAGKYPEAIQPDTTSAAQRAELVALADAAAKCGLPAPAGFRATRFTSNDATGPLLDEFALAFLERSARDELLSIYTFQPYRAPGHTFAILPMPVRVAYGEVGSLCDTSSCGSLSAPDFATYLRAAIDFHLRHREPLILEWHPELTEPNNRDGWWTAFIGVLDHLQAQADEVDFVTARELVRRRGL